MRAQAWPLDAQMRMDLWKVLMNRTSLRAAVQRRNPDEFSARRFPVVARMRSAEVVDQSLGIEEERTWCGRARSSAFDPQWSCGEIWT